jgi:hypothetical protein
VTLLDEMTGDLQEALLIACCAASWNSLQSQTSRRAGKYGTKQNANADSVWEYAQTGHATKCVLEVIRQFMEIFRKSYDNKSLSFRIYKFIVNFQIHVLIASLYRRDLDRRL